MTLIETGAGKPDFSQPASQATSKMGPFKTLPKCIQAMVSILARFGFKTEASAFKCGYFD